MNDSGDARATCSGSPNSQLEGAARREKHSWADGLFPRSWLPEHRECQASGHLSPKEMKLLQGLACYLRLAVSNSPTVMQGRSGETGLGDVGERGP